MLEEGTLNLPIPESLPGRSLPTHYVFIVTSVPTPYVFIGRSIPPPYVFIGRSVPTPYVFTGRSVPTSNVFIGRSVPTPYLFIGISVPTPYLLIGRSVPAPCVFIGDDGFALQPNFMKPFLRKNLDLFGRICNYRFSRPRRISENVFGIITNRWRLYGSPISLHPEQVREITMRVLTLQKWLQGGS